MTRGRGKHKAQPESNVPIFGEDQLDALVEAMSSAIKTDRRADAGRLYAAQSEELRKGVLRAVETTRIFFDATVQSSDYMRICRDTDRGGCHHRMYSDLFQQHVLGISRQRNAFVQHIAVCPKTCDGGGLCRVPDAHGKKRRTLADAAKAPPATPSTFKAIVTGQQAAYEALMHYDGVGSIDEVPDAAGGGDHAGENNVVQSPMIVVPHSSPALDQQPLAAPVVEHDYAAQDAIAAPVSEARAAEVAPLGQDPSSASVNVRLLETLAAIQRQSQDHNATMQRQAQEFQVAMLGAINKLVSAADPAHATPRQANRKRPRPPHQERLLEHLHERLRSERRGRAGLMPPAPVQAAGWRPARQAASSEQSERRGRGAVAAPMSPHRAPQAVGAGPALVVAATPAPTVERLLAELDEDVDGLPQDNNEVEYDEDIMAYGDAGDSYE